MSGGVFIPENRTGWRFQNLGTGPAIIPVRQPDGTIKHIPLTTARKP